MGSRAKATDSDAALLPKEVGTRLRQLRLEAGLTQPMKAKVEVKAKAEATKAPAQTLTSTSTLLPQGASDPMAVHLQGYSRKVFGALRRTRKARPVWREKAIAKLDSWAAEHGLPSEPFTTMKHAVVALFADMERKGELD